MRIFNNAYLKMILCFLSIASPVQAHDLTASMADIPGLVEDKDTGAFVELVKAIDEVYTDGKIIRKVYPFKRSIRNVEDETADFHIPLLKNPFISLDSLPYRYISVRNGIVTFVIYSHKDNPITKQNIELANKDKTKSFPYKIETLRGHKELFNFEISEINQFYSGLAKVVLGRTDAFIMPQEECDAIIRNKKLWDLHREKYADFDDMIIVKKGKKGDDIDKIISDALNRLESDGRLKEIYYNIHKPYIEWQPYLKKQNIQKSISEW